MRTSSSPSADASVALEAGLEAGLLEVVQEILGLVLEAEDVDVGADGDVGERDTLDPAAGDDRVAVGARRGVADRGEHALLEHGRHRVLEALGLLVDLVPGNPEHVGQEALDQAVAADYLTPACSNPASVKLIALDAARVM